MSTRASLFDSLFHGAAMGSSWVLKRGKKRPNFDSTPAKVASASEYPPIWSGLLLLWDTKEEYDESSVVNFRSNEMKRKRRPRRLCHLTGRCAPASWAPIYLLPTGEYRQSRPWKDVGAFRTTSAWHQTEEKTSWLVPQRPEKVRKDM